MSEDQEQVTTGAVGTPRWIGLAVGVLAAISIVALGIGWTASRRAWIAERGLKEVSVNHQVLSQRLAQSEQINAQLQGQLNVITDRLKLTRGELSRARKQAKQISEDYSKQVADIQTSLAAKANAEDVKALGNDVTGVKTDLESTKQNLQMARGELGTLIARDHEEIEQLRRLGQRDYFEFTLARKGAREKVGDLMVELRDTNTKKHQFSVALYVDDMRLEKRNRAINEPIYFYARGSRVPFELVINQVSRNKVVGYISVPKANAQTATGG